MNTNVNPGANVNYANQPQSAPIMTVKDWLITMLILIIPLVNLIMLFVWAFGGGANPNKSNYAKAALLWMVIGFVVYLIFTFLIIGLIGVSTYR
ncbi:hypothetical protein [Paenibacillus ehimensis]|uniref:Uncharacterized protein n=1 Tax=Paenibacillus ehimensis TaxID=79264 RepID=A0ABT8VDP4_9BACL|nr:hypothetical protein [Paenibacillus ehimensis]MDO3679089.1 hypothetical protein [Paenibacillus ehimensis]MEC0210210.1 hypothetical protein [Paenibacillus ehimensis]